VSLFWYRYVSIFPINTHIPIFICIYFLVICIDPSPFIHMCVWKFIRTQFPVKGHSYWATFQYFGSALRGGGVGQQINKRPDPVYPMSVHIGYCSRWRLSVNSVAINAQSSKHVKQNKKCGIILDVHRGRASILIRTSILIKTKRVFGTKPKAGPDGPNAWYGRFHCPNSPLLALVCVNSPEQYFYARHFPDTIAPFPWLSYGLLLNPKETYDWNLCAVTLSV